MGVRGLTTYINNRNNEYLKYYMLHDCYIIIDGNSLAYQIYMMFASRAHAAFGGNYDKYGQSIKEFFSLLAKCAIKPIVLFDGGYEPRKIGTVLKRLREKVKEIKNMVPVSQNCTLISPLLMKIVIKEVLREIGVPFVQCDHEADQEIASLARKYNCPVLSNDSDFFIFDVSYIPLRTLRFEALPLTFQLEQVCDKYYMPCKVYKVEFFFNRFGGLDKSMMPLLASFLGNDYIKISVFRKFYSQFKFTQKKGSFVEKRVARLIEWLKNETFDSAIEKVLRRTKTRARSGIKKQIMKSLNAYNCCDSTVKQYLPSEFVSGIITENFSIPCQVDCAVPCAESSDIIEKMEVVDDGQSSEEDSLSEDDEKIDVCDNLDRMDVDVVNDLQKMASESPMKIPEWLMVRSRKGNIEPCVYDILTLRTYFAIPQIESHLYTASHATSIPLLKKICKLLLGNLYENITVWMKSKNGLILRYLLHLTNTPIITDIELIPTMPVANRTSLFLHCLDIPDAFCIDSFPNELKLYVCAMLSWIKSNPEPQITDSHVISLFMCIVATNIIHSKVGFYNNKIEFLEKHGKTQEIIINRIKNDMDKKSISNCDINSEVVLEMSSKNTSVKQIYSSITFDECIAVYDEFYHYHQLDVNLKHNRKLFSTRTVHSFSQFQSCLYHAIILNSILDYPLDQPVISQLYSGTFVYNMCTTLSKVENVSKHIHSLLKYSPSILNLIETMFTAVSSVVKIAPVCTQINKRNKRRRKKKAKLASADENIQITDEDDDKSEEEKKVEESYNDESNRFSMLSTM